MPIRIQNELPAFKTLESENIFVMTNERAISQDIRPLKIIILNLMPNKIETETQLLRLLGNTPLQVDIELLQTATQSAKLWNGRKIMFTVPSISAGVLRLVCIIITVYRNIPLKKNSRVSMSTE